jgi:hypothetical protein
MRFALLSLKAIHNNGVSARIPHQSAARTSLADSFSPGEAKAAYGGNRSINENLKVFPRLGICGKYIQLNRYKIIFWAEPSKTLDKFGWWRYYILYNMAQNRQFARNFKEVIDNGIFFLWRHPPQGEQILRQQSAHP